MIVTLRKMMRQYGAAAPSTGAGIGLPEPSSANLNSRVSKCALLLRI